MVEKRTVLKWFAAAVVLALILLLPDGYTSGVKGFFRNLITPVQFGILKVGRSLKEGADTVRGFGGMAEENRRLKGEVVRLQAAARLSKSIEEENLKLRRMLAFHERHAHDLIAAEVAARSISGWWQSIRIAKGTREGVFANHAVVSPDGLVGRTSEVSAHSADVLLMSDPACEVSARISRTGSFGLVSGAGVNLKGYPVVRMRFIHKDIPVQVGDEVVTSGLGGVFPRDVIIGYVESVRTEEAGLYQIAEILPQAVINLNDVVFVTAVEGDGE